MTTGMRMLERRFACMAESRSAWLRSWKSSMERRSWQKTLTTFSPWMVSSMKPLTSPRRCCWSAKCLPAAPPILPAAISMRATITSVIIVSGTESTIIETSVMAMVTAELTNCGMVWLMSWRSVSMSLV